MTATSKRRDDIQLEDDEQIAAVLDKEGAPIYFAINASMTNFEGSLLAFEVKHGRKPTSEELTLLGMIERNNNG